MDCARALVLEGTVARGLVDETAGWISIALKSIGYWLRAIERL